MARIDIVVPCYNYGRFLDSSVGSVLEQSMRDLRVLIIDDASTDESLSVARKLARDDPRVSVIAHHRNKGHINTYNEGIAWASAEYFLLLSADDLLVPGALQRAIEIMDKNPDIVLTHGESVLWYDDQPRPLVANKQAYTWARHDLLSEICATATNLVSTPTAIGRTRVQKTAGGYKESLPHSGDMEMWLRFAAHGAVARINAIQAIYRRHPSAMSNAYFAQMASDHRQRQQAFDSFFDEYDDRLTNSHVLRSVVGRVLAKRAFRCGIGLFRRGRVNEGLQLLRAAMGDGLRCLSPSRPVARDGAKSDLKAAGEGIRELSEVLAGPGHERDDREHRSLRR